MCRTACLSVPCLSLRCALHRSARVTHSLPFVLLCSNAMSEDEETSNPGPRATAAGKNMRSADLNEDMSPMVSHLSGHGLDAVGTRWCFIWLYECRLIQTSSDGQVAALLHACPFPRKHNVSDGEPSRDKGTSAPPLVGDDFSYDPGSWGCCLPRRRLQCPFAKSGPGQVDLILTPQSPVLWGRPG